MKLEKTNEAKALLKRLNTLIIEDSSTKEYIHSAEIAKISRKLHSMKLKDEFLINALTEAESAIFDKALIISSTSK